MPQRITNGQGATALGLNAIILRTEGYSVASGCGVTIGGSLDEIQLRVGAGSIYHDGRLLPVEEQTVTLQPNVSTSDRKDLIWIDREGNARVQRGVADAQSTKPPSKEAANTAIPAPPDAARLNGVPICEVWVPAGASSSGDIEADFKQDRRMGAGGSGSGTEVRDADPPDEELIRYRRWYNTSTGEEKVYYPDVREVHTYQTTLDRGLDAPEQRVIENFEDSIDANWRGGDSQYSYNTPAFEGNAAAAWDENSITRDYSLKGDGLDYYPEPGDRIRLAVRFDSGSERYASLGFGKASDDYYSGYSVRLEPDGELRLQVSDDQNNVSTLGSAAGSISAGEWHIIEAGYDAGGRGVHHARLWSTANGAVDQELASITSPTANEDHRDVGLFLYAFAESGEIRLDRLTVTPGGA